MEALRWTNPHRKRNIHASYNSPDYVRGYDIDINDFTYIVNKLHNEVKLTEAENDRYGMYVLAVIECILEGPKWKNKSHDERFELRDQMYYEMLIGMHNFDQSKGSSIFSYSYRIGYVAACHYYKDLNNKLKRQQAIEDHCNEELEEYRETYSTHKVTNVNS